jgi:hypothetical protein
VVRTAERRGGAAARYDGSSWSLSPLPAAELDGWWELRAAATSGANDAWLVGVDHGPDRDAGLALHWNGRSWSRVAIPGVGVASALLGVATRSASDAWAVGGYTSSFEDPTPRPLVLHWDGAAWTRQSSPTGTGTTLTGIATVPGSFTGLRGIGSSDTSCFGVLRS